MTRSSSNSLNDCNRSACNMLFRLTSKEQRALVCLAAVLILGLIGVWVL